MYTPHGHQIPGTPVEENKPALVARCGGPQFCRDCFSFYEAKDKIVSSELPKRESGVIDTAKCNDSTLEKVYDALIDSGLTRTATFNAINEMLNRGILFVERR